MQACYHQTFYAFSLWLIVHKITIKFNSIVIIQKAPRNNYSWHYDLLIFDMLFSQNYKFQMLKKIRKKISLSLSLISCVVAITQKVINICE